MGTNHSKPLFQQRKSNVRAEIGHATDESDTLTGHWTGSSYLCKSCHRLSEYFAQKFDPSCFPAFADVHLEKEQQKSIIFLRSCDLCDMVAAVARLRKS